ncbi:MAG: diacylglycerol kinase [candidate division NC10 bacterium RBG_16_65_8]|nr:MAG: diacylglycerol kinase [candidate division NC10 bacterium RBG_16_65_8]
MVTQDTQPAGLIARLWNGTRYSLQGLRAAWTHEQAFRLEVGVFLLVLPAAWWLGKDGGARSLLIGSCGMVLVVELVNSALEAAVDRLGPERHELAGRAKDFGSAAVFLAILLAGVTWALCLFG